MSLSFNWRQSEILNTTSNQCNLSLLINSTNQRWLRWKVHEKIMESCDGKVCQDLCMHYLRLKNSIVPFFLKTMVYAWCGSSEIILLCSLMIDIVHEMADGLQSLSVFSLSGTEEKFWKTKGKFLLRKQALDLRHWGQDPTTHYIYVRNREPKFYQICRKFGQNFEKMVKFSTKFAKF